ncbi:MAG: phytoene/squalene synthase family protein [Deltaproteobacteria bacterium]|nr:phytoene/squalene synthase family protein [Deltaproteobacteria bacterium]
MPEGLPNEVRAALDECRWMIAKGSKSFSLAAKLFEPENRHAAFFLYGWCRYCDDQVDEAGQQADRAQMERRVAELKRATLAAFTNEAQDQAVFVAMQYIVRRYAIPSHYALELIEGMAMDVRQTRYRTLDELLLYCYRVAGTVGLMMSHVMGLRDQTALKHAADLGIAMQLTNIARDIIEDAALGRIYLPQEWLDQAGVAAEEIAEAKNRAKLAQLTQRLLQRADDYYRSGDAGLWHLSFRSACAVSAARQVYSEIGSLLLRRGAHAWDQRTYVTGVRKIRVVLRGVGKLLSSLPARCARPWSPVPIDHVLTFAQVR